ncbi:MAG: prepilin peptidase [Elusimicrobiota bacterium]
MVGLYFFIIGTFFGSFANVVIRRLPYGKSIVKPASHCPKCLIPIKWYDNIPIVSFFLLKGKCRNCKTTISPEYLFVELVTAVYFLMAYFHFGLTSIFFISLFLGFSLIVISFTDLHLKIIPDNIIILLLVFGLSSSFFNPVVNFNFLNSIKGALFGGVLLFLIAFVGCKIYKKDVLGGGDIKLLAAGGSFLGLQNIFFAFFVACFIGGIIGLFLILIKNKKKSDFMPFGPFISIGILIILYIGLWK